MTDLLAIMKAYWGYSRFLPLQREAMTSVLNERDSLVVLPTGGGKSLCFQVPALAMQGMAVVVSPLISLMKDQVDALVQCGVAADCLNSSLLPEERRATMSAARAGRLKMLYIAPERLVQNKFISFLRDIDLSFIAVDEAHCISMWGHDFRPEYRELRILKEVFPAKAIHSYTATATEHVRTDIARQLDLDSPEVLVGSFDRPNLIYRVARRRAGRSKLQQLREVIDRHKGESGIIYCITRKDVEHLSGQLNQLGYRSLPYHAGMEDVARKNNQDAFIREEIDIIVATVAFGMGIDKSNVRYVIHAGMPKSLEHYQQESGRAGRDGLEAECCLFFSLQDYAIWQRILGKPTEGSTATASARTNGSAEASTIEPMASAGRSAEAPTIEPLASAGRSAVATTAGAPQRPGETAEEAVEVALAKTHHMLDYCTGVSCRHKTILDYFGQKLAKDRCDACDVCLGDLDLVDDSLAHAQKILSCVVRLRERFGSDYAAKVVAGSTERRILENGHDRLSTYGLLSRYRYSTLRDWIDQLISQEYLCKWGEYNILKVTSKGWRVIRGQEEPRLLRPAEKREKKPKVAVDSWDAVDPELFQELRNLRRRIARQKGVPPFVVFSDAALRDMARRRPTTPAGFLQVHGVGYKKQTEYAEAFLKAIADHSPIGFSEAEEL